MLRKTLIALLLISSFAAAQKRPFTFEDMMALKRIGDPQPSPDGRWVAFSAMDVNLGENTRKSHIWLVPLTGGDAASSAASTAARQITNGKGESRARWSPDGKHLLYETEDQIWLADFESSLGQIRNNRRVTSISTGASGALWSPDGKTIVFTSTVWPECNAAGDSAAQDACNKQKDEAKAASKVKASIFTGLLFRHWNAYTGAKRAHLFVQSIAGDLGMSEGDSDHGPAARDLTPGAHDVPPFSLGGQDDYAISPDGKEVCFTSNHDEVGAISTNNDLFLVPIAGGTPKKITTNPGSDSTPLYSPDGRYIAYRAQFRAGYESDRFRLLLYERATGKSIDTTSDFDHWVGSYAWAQDSKAIYFSADHKGHALIYSLQLTPPYVRSSIVAGHNDEITVTADGKTLVFSRMSLTAPNEIYASDAGVVGCPSRTGDVDPGMGPKCSLHKDRAVTHVNDALLAQVSMAEREGFFFKGAENADVEGFLVRPPNFDATKKYPMKFLIHGGPQGQWGDAWSFRWNPQLFAASGYVVIMVNPRGSTGYGQKFIDDINGDWGGRAYQDLMLGLDYAEKTYPFIDKTRECALGASYGGYMINWMLGHTTRFKCFVSHDGMFNAESAYGSTEELWFNEWEFKGLPWNNRALYEKWSPHMYATNFKTPTLVVHGQLDYRLDVSEGFQLFTTLQRLKVPSKMLYFPDEGHWVLKPQNSQLWYKTVNDWVDQWTK